MKSLPDDNISVITRLFNVVLMTGLVPEAWCIGAIVPLYKGKGPKDDLDNYRGITLLSCLGKLFTSLINKRLTVFLDSTGAIGAEQAGFRKAHSTTDHVFALHMLIKLYKQKGKRIYAAFVDYRKAFDFVDRSALWTKLLKEGINGRVLTVIMNIYAKAKSCVKCNSRISKTFPSNVGVRQGENLSPLLFSLFLNDFEYSISRRSADTIQYRGLPFISQLYEQEMQDLADIDVFFRMYCLLYADDTIIMAESDQELQSALNALHTYCTKWKLTVNVQKTKVVIFSRGLVRIAPAFVYGNQHIEIVRQYTYLGVVFYANGKFDVAITQRIDQATLALNALKWRARKLRLPLDVTLELFDKCVKPVLLYGCEVWGWDDLSSLDIFQRNFYKECLGLKQSCSNNMVYAELGQMPISYDARIRMATYWLRLKQGRNTKIASRLLGLCQRLHQNPSSGYSFEWMESIKQTLAAAGLEAVWNSNAPLLDSESLKQQLWEAARLQFGNKWSEEVALSRTCQTYKALMPTWNPELSTYLTILNFYQRRAVARFRCRSNFLPMSSYLSHRPDYSCLCPLCNNDNADEGHYLLSCPYFDIERARLLPHHLRELDPQLSLVRLLNCSELTPLKNIARFIENVLNVFKDLQSLATVN